MFQIRNIHPSDFDDVFELAKNLDTLNLPADRKRLRRAISASYRSFQGKIDSRDELEYIFALEDMSRNKLIGTSLIVPQHGTEKRPAIYFDVEDRVHTSDSLNRSIDHQLLVLNEVTEGQTEIGALVVDPEYRGHELKLGKLLSLIRFLYIGLHRDHFHREIVAELLPPLGPNRLSHMWQHLGANFTHLDYQTADRISRSNVEFITSLFPSSPIYTALLPEEVQNDIGRVGPETKPAKKILGDLGFEWDGTVDPFDGGPTYRVKTDKCEAVQRVERIRFSEILDNSTQRDGLGLVCYHDPDASPLFRAFFGDYKLDSGELLFASPTVDESILTPGDKYGFLPLTGPDMLSLW